MSLAIDLPSQKELNRLFSYDPETGLVTRLSSNNGNVKVGDIVGTDNGKGRLKTEINKVSYYLSRIIWVIFYGSIPNDMQVDHKNKIRDDNRISNLRLLSNKDNNRSKSKYKNNKSGCTGVYLLKKDKFEAIITVNGKIIHLGYFNNFNSAVIARLSAESKYGFFKGHGK